jgi:CheY-like chemotaxis protein
MDIHGSVNVLLVDDRTTELDSYAEYLERRPWMDVTARSSPEAALEELQNGRIDCLVSDSVHTADGEPLVERVDREYPDLPVILHTGSTGIDTGAADAVVRKGTGVGGMTGLEALQLRIHDVLGRDSQPENGHGWQVLGHHDWDDGETPSTATVTALAAETGTDPGELDPLYGWIDPDALDRTLRSTATGAGGHVELRFDYDGYTVRVDSAGLLAFRERDDDTAT